MRATIVTLGLVLAAAGGAWAQTDDDADHSAHHPQAEAAKAPAAPQVVAAPRAGAGDFRRIEALMRRIQQTADPAQRAELLREHLLALREQVRALRAAGAKRTAMTASDTDQPALDDARAVPAPAVDTDDDPHAAHRQASAVNDDPHAAHKPSAGEASGGKGGMKKGMMGAGMMKMHQRVDQRLDAIEQMLEQLIEREIVESGAR